MEPKMNTDWKDYSHQLRILRIRSSDEGLKVDWTKMMQLYMDKDKKGKLFYKTSHSAKDFQAISLVDSRTTGKTEI